MTITLVANSLILLVPWTCLVTVIQGFSRFTSALKRLERERKSVQFGEQVINVVTTIVIADGRTCGWNQMRQVGNGWLEALSKII